VVTLCGLLAYRGLARVLSQDRTGSLGDQFTTVKFFTSGSLLGLPMPAWIALAVGAAAHVFLRYTIWGRYIYAIGNNEEASLYSGINVRRTKIITYVICSVLGAISGTLEASYIGSVTPSSTGTFYELYAIAAAVLGGCSLRGGQGMVLGILLGAVTIQLIGNVTRLLGVPSQFEYVILGTVILVGALVDASLERYGNRRLQQQQRRAD
jgi:ribose transport system permease protein